jgi:4-amino-4-deoxy-L-arabinose transferase-like glycosyltransferase
MSLKMTLTKSPLLRNIYFICGSIILAIVLATAFDYGIAWDAQIQAVYGYKVLLYFLSFGEDKSCNAIYNLRFYGGFFELLLAPLSSSLTYQLRHIATALIGLCTVFPLIKIAKTAHKQFFVPLVFLFLMILPRFYGHSFINSKDIPLAFFYSCSMFYLLKASYQNAPASSFVKLGIFIGLSASTRPGILPLLAVVCAVYICLVNIKSLNKEFVFKYTKYGILVFVISWIVMILFWPWAHQNPIVHPYKAIRMAAHFSEIYTVLFNGKLLLSNQLPFYYFPFMLFITLPLIHIVFSIVSLFLSLRWTKLPERDKRILILSFCWVFLPILVVILAKSSLYDGIRHLLFVLPGVVLLASYGASETTRFLVRKKKAYISILILALGCFPVIREMVQIHPYQYTYFNELVSGVSGAYGNHYTDYWVTSYKEAAEWVSLDAKERLEKGEKIHVVIGGRGGCLIAAALYLDKGITAELIQTGMADPDYYIGVTRESFEKKFPRMRTVKEIGRKGAVFSVVKKKVSSR